MDNIISYILFGLITVILTVIFTIIVKKLAWRFKVLDYPKPGRKIHTKAMPLLGGVAIFSSYFIILLLGMNRILSGNLEWHHWLGVFVGGLLIIIGGVLDDKYNLFPKQQIIFPLLAILAVIVGGVQIEKITNPLGGFVWLGFLSNALIFAWLLGMMYTTKLLDGLDGLVTGVVGIGAFIIFLFTLSPAYYQPDIAFAAFILALACFGFWLFNWHPAKIFLGEGGSLFLGYILGVLAIISGGKIAITLLVMGIPVLDVFLTIMRRLFAGQNPFRHSDRRHLHFRLLDLGLSQRQVALFFYVFALVFGLLALALQSKGKMLALVVLVGLMFLIVVYLSLQEKKKPVLLLHICCAVCGAYVGQLLSKKYKVVFYYYNPNLYPEAEYEKRLDNVLKVAKHLGIRVISRKEPHQLWLQRIKGMEQEKERGKRCLVCYQNRLEAVASLAKKKKFPFFASTLSISPHKDGIAISRIGQALAKEYKVTFLDQDFKKNDGFKKSGILAKELNLYRQDYCGCEFSMRKEKSML